MIEFEVGEKVSVKMSRSDTSQNRYFVCRTDEYYYCSAETEQSRNIYGWCIAEKIPERKYRVGETIKTASQCIFLVQLDEDIIGLVALGGACVGNILHKVVGDTVKISDIPEFLR